VQDDDIEPGLDRVLVAAFLVAAIPQVLRITKDGELGGTNALLVTAGDLVRLVLAGIVEHHDLFDLRHDLGRNAGEH